MRRPQHISGGRAAPRVLPEPQPRELRIRQAREDLVEDVKVVLSMRVRDDTHLMGRMASHGGVRYGENWGCDKWGGGGGGGEPHLFEEVGMHLGAGEIGVRVSANLAGAKIAIS